MLSKYSLKFKLISLCLLLVLFTVLTGVLGYLTLANVKTEYSFISKKVLPKLEYMNDMFLNYRRVRITLRTLGIQNVSSEMAKQAVAEAEHSIAEYEKAKNAYVALGFVNGQKELFDKVDLAWNDFKKIGGDVISLSRTETPENKEKMLSIFFTTCPEKANIFSHAIEDLEKFHKTEAHSKSDVAEAHAEEGLHVTLAVVIASSLVGLFLGLLFASVLSKTLSRIAADVAMSSAETSSASTQMAMASSQLASGSSESAASLQETVASIEELTTMVQKNSEHSELASNLAQKSTEDAESGKLEILKLTSAMSDISNSSKKIEEIIKVIDDIAFQTNLLALNAAVEAARAGEQGRGFAVVAEAVRNLAQKSAVAAKDISSLITENVSNSRQGVILADSSGQVFKNILESVKKVSTLSTEIASGSKEQAVGIQQISKAINQLDQAIQGNAASAEETAASSEEMSSQAQSLLKLVADLKTVIAGHSTEVPYSGQASTLKNKSSESPYRKAA